MTDYYKYYTQTSVIHHPSRLMHTHREQRKAVEYNRLKKMLDLSNSDANSCSKSEREETRPAPSFCILEQLTLTNVDEESVMLEKLKVKLHQGFGPNPYSTI